MKTLKQNSKKVLSGESFNSLRPSIFGRKFDTLYLACQDAISAVTLCEEDLCILTQALESIQEKTGSLHQTCNRLVAEEVGWNICS